MKQLYYIFFLLILVSCNDNINDTKYRNSNYAFYKKNGYEGVWQKIEPNSNFKNEPGIITYFFDDGTIFGTKEILDSLSNNIVSYYNNNKVIEINYYRNDSIFKIVKIDGFHFEYLSSKGNIYSKGLIKNNQEQGKWEEFDKDGDLEAIRNFKNGLRHGKFTEFYKNGKIKSIGKMWNGIKHDTIKWFYENGKIRCIEINKLDTIKKTSNGIANHYFENGNLNTKITTLNEKRNGMSERYYENGKLKALLEYKNDVADGEAIGYYESGKINYKGKAKYNKIDGDLNYYNEKGKLFKTINYKNGYAIDSIIHE